MRTPIPFRLISGLFILAICACSACSSSPQATEVAPPGQLAVAQVPRVSQPAPAGDLALAVAGNTRFALDLYGQLAGGSGNLVFSPYSITTALAMTYAGTAGSTASAFESVLHIAMPADRFHRAMNTLDTALRGRGAGASGDGQGPFRLSVDNQVFSQSGFTVKPVYLDLMAAEYGSGVRLLDFAAAAEPARQAINAWVADTSAGLLPQLLAPGSVNSLTRLTLVNTLYFSAGWAAPFDPQATGQAGFHLLDGSVRNVPTMAGSGVGSALANVDGAQVIELPYAGNDTSMVLIVPAAGQFVSFEQQLASRGFGRYIAALQSQRVDLHLPKVQFAASPDLPGTLSRLGLDVAFGESADFSAMTDRPVKLDAVAHQAVVRVDEAGTTAAAASSVQIGVTSMPNAVSVDRPFIFFVRDLPTGAIVLLGRVVDPG